DLESHLNRLLESDDDVAGPAPVRPRMLVNPSLVRAVFELINRKRVENGQKPLAWSSDLAMMANLHSQNMAEYRFVGHRGLDNKTVSDRAYAIGVRGWRAIGENI